MAPNSRHDDDSYSFAKLKGPENYELWSNNMAGALGSSGHWVFIDDPDSRREPPRLKSTDDDDEDRIELIWNREEKRAKYFSDILACIAKMYRQCSYNIQQQLDAQKDGGILKKGNWSPRELWEFIQKICTDQGWGVK